MSTSNHLNGTIDSLIQINFERMSTFDKASQSTTDEELKNYFENRADESERHIEELERRSRLSCAKHERWEIRCQCCTLGIPVYCSERAPCTWDRSRT